MFARLFGGGKKLDAELHAAAQSGDMAGLRQSLEKGADIDALDSVHRETALHIVVGTSDVSRSCYPLMSKDSL